MDEWREIEALKQLKARYFRFLDTKQWESWRDLFTGDALLKVHSVVTTWGGEPQLRQDIQGSETIMTTVRALIDNSVTVHQGHMPEINLTSPTTATGIWAMEDIVENSQGRMRGHGHYHETYEMIGGKWLIKTIRLTRLRIEVINLWPNRLIGDAGLPPEKRLTHTNIAFKGDASLLSSGLLGPLTLKGGGGG